MKKNKKVKSKGLSFTKTDWIILSIIEISILSFLLFIFFWYGLAGRYMPSISPDALNQHIQFMENFRDQFYNSKNILPQFIPNLGGGQNAFYFGYHGFFNPIILPFYALPFLSGYSYYFIIATATILATTWLTYYWLKSRFSSIFTTIGTLSMILTNSIMCGSYFQFVFFSSLPFHILVLIGIDRIAKKKSPAALIIAIVLISLTNFVSLLPCAVLITLWIIFIYFEKNLKIKIKSLILFATKILVFCISGIALAAFIILPTIIPTFLSRSGVKASYTLFDLLYPSLYIFPEIQNVFLNNYRTIYSMSSLGIAAVNLLFLCILLFSQNKKYIYLTSAFLILCIFPIFSYVLNMFNYIFDKVFISFLPIYAILITQSFKLIHKNIHSIRMPNLNKKIAFGLVIIFSCLSTAILPIRNYLENPNHFTENFYSSKIHNSEVNYTKSFLKTAKSQLKNNQPIYRSTISSSQDQYLGECQYYPINKILSNNYFTDSIYTSSNNTGWQNYQNNILWNESKCTCVNWTMQNANSIFNRTLLGEKYLFLEKHDTKTDTTGYQNTHDYVWQNNNVFSLGYATNNLFSNMQNMDDVEQKASLIQGISLTENTADEKTLLKNLAYNNNSPKIDNFEKLNLSDIFKEEQKGLTIFRLHSSLNKTYKLPKKLTNSLLFIKVKLNKAILDEKQSYNGLKINNITHIFQKDVMYNSENTDLRFIIPPDKKGNLENLKMTLSQGTWPIDSIEAFTMPVADIQNAYKNFDQMNVKQFNTNGLFGDINITRPNSMIAFSIGYDSGFTLKIDGVQTPIFEVNGGIIGANTPPLPGYHNIELTYSAPYYMAGIAISAITLILLIGSGHVTKIARFIRRR
ncbi:MAG: YfhO family protein [Bifidobacteriaceae bacterium]|jgi:hypothetical protein|nr:YfhO family protein [Bifidobacteriaceae bacterium]